MKMKLYPHKTSTMAAGVVGMRIVLGYLLLLSIMIVGIKAAPTAPQTFAITDDHSSAVATCGRPAADECSTPQEFTGQTPNCTYQFFYGDSFNATNKVADQAEDKIIPMRNDWYWCRVVHKTEGDGAQKKADKKVDFLTTMPSSITAAPAAPVCGKDKVTLTCTKGAKGTSDKKMKQLRFVELDKTDVTYWETLEDSESKLIHEIHAPHAETKYNCEARATEVDGTGAYPSVSNAPVTVAGCTPCNDNGAAAEKCPEGFKCDTHASPATCKYDTAPTKTPTSAASVNPAHTTGVSGGGGKDTTGSKGGTTSGASDLGRPASVLTIVCSLLTLTLNLRG